MNLYFGLKHYLSWFFGQRTKGKLHDFFSAMPLSKNQFFVKSHSVDLSTETRVLFFEVNWNIKVKAVAWWIVTLWEVRPLL